MWADSEDSQMLIDICSWYAFFTPIELGWYQYISSWSSPLSQALTHVSPTKTRPSTAGKTMSTTTSAS
jgi:hypothetical protein